MVTKNSLFTQISIFSLAFSSEIALAVEPSTTEPSSIQSWPFFVLVALLIVFRKQLFAEATPESPHSDEHHAEETVTEKTAVAVEEPAQVVVEKTTTSDSTVVELSKDDKQCQASTAKGTRCKRTTSLEQAKVDIDGTSYNLTVCKQHNNDAIKPFSELIK